MPNYAVTAHLTVGTIIEAENEEAMMEEAHRHFERQFPEGADGPEVSRITFERMEDT